MLGDIATVASAEENSLARLKLWASSIIMPTSEDKCLTPLSQLGLTWKGHLSYRASCVLNEPLLGLDHNTASLCVPLLA